VDVDRFDQLVVVLTGSNEFEGVLDFDEGADALPHEVAVFGQHEPDRHRARLLSVSLALIPMNPGIGDNDLMTDVPEEKILTDADLEAVDAAEAPEIAEELADRLESELEAIETRTPGRDG
jgi:hypothetical protein